MNSMRLGVCVAAILATAACGGGGGGDDDHDTVVDVEANDGEASTDVPGEESAGESDAAPDVEPLDLDGDTYPEGEDCDDADPDVHPGATELCNGLDDNCDGTTDEPSAADATTWYADDDGDGAGDAASTRNACERPAGYVANADDCDDSDNLVGPGADEICNGADDDCDGETDENGATGATAYYPDTDVDGYGDDSGEVFACSMPTGYTPYGGDCEDGNEAVNPDAVESCNGIDDNCNGTTDEETAVGTSVFYRDADHDGFGDPHDTTVACVAPAGYVADDTDCDDGDAAISPAAADLPDLLGVDLDCDGVDGDLELAIFVSVADGRDSATGRGTLNPDGSLSVDPVRTLSHAMELADACDPKCYVLVRAGTYPQSVPGGLPLVSGVSLYGGYNSTWVRNRPIGDTVISAEGAGVYRTLLANGLTAPVTLERLTIEGPNPTNGGLESVALLVVATADASLLTLRAVEVNAGNGAAGTAGASGTTPSCTVNGGGGGTSFGCGTTAGGTVAGCTGGAAGTNHCRNDCFTAAPGATDGMPGGNGTTGGNGATGGAASTDSDGSFSGEDWLPAVASNGRDAGHGGGGCGGGGGGWWRHYCALEFCVYDLAGGNGGSGGRGGCGGRGGAGGGQGGGSFGIVLLDSSFTVDTVGVRLGNGGGGGTGGNGADGSGGLAGGSGVSGSAMTNCGAILVVESGSGGDGGNGGGGGGGAGGGGGNGGPSIGLVLLGTSTPPVSIPTYDVGTATAGAGGSGGNGGRQAGTGTVAPNGARGINGRQEQVLGF